MYTNSGRLLKILKSTSQPPNASIIVNSATAEPYVKPMRNATCGYLRELRRTCPYESIREALESAMGVAVNRGFYEERASLPDKIRQELDLILTEWADGPHSDLQQIAAALAGAALAGFMAAFLAWKEETGVSGDLVPDVVAKLTQWFSQNAKGLLDKIAATVRKAIVAIVKRGAEKGLSSEQIVEQIRQYVDSHEFDSTLSDAVSEGEVLEAFHGGALEMNRLLAAVSKQWLAMPGACKECVANAYQGLVPLEATFSSGHSCPPAHMHCRCDVAYCGVDREDVQRLTDD